MERKELFDKVIQYFQTHMPVAETELHYRDPFHLMVAVILSAQCTDKRVNQITPGLLDEYPDPVSMAKAEPEDLLKYIGSCSYPNNKARHLIGMARKLMELYGGNVPSDIDDLQRLPGIGRKSANVIASVVYNKPAMAVDTHVFRVSNRIGLTNNSKTPLATEKQLVKNIPKEKLAIAHHWLILHGRYVCIARKPKCQECGIREFCRFYRKQLSGE